MMKVTFKGKHLALAGYLLLVIPLIFFLFGWTKWYVALLGALFLSAGLLWLYRHDFMVDSRQITLSIGHVVAIIAILALWVAFSGNCGFSYGLDDIPWRNTILADLINYDWPVTYHDGFSLAYYFAIWLIPAAVGKLLGWGAALFTLWLYETCLVVTAVFLIGILLDAQGPAVFWMITVVFMLWSGLNLVGSACMEIVGKNEQGFKLDSNEAYCDVFYYGEATNFYYRSNFDCISESYNQIAVWLVVPLMLFNRKARSFIYLEVILALFSPWVVIGLIPLMIALGVLQLIDEARRRRKEGLSRPSALAFWTIREVFSPANCCALLVAIPIALFIFAGLQQTAVGAVMSSDVGRGFFGILTISAFNGYNWMGYILFITCEFLVFAVFLFRKFKSDPFFWVVIASLMLIPFFWIGNIAGRDFCMDASLGSLCVLMIFVMRYLKDEVMGKPLTLRNLAFSVVLIVAFMSPVFQLANDVSVMYAHKSLWVITNDADVPETLEGLPAKSIANFVCEDPAHALFFNLFAR